MLSAAAAAAAATAAATAAAPAALRANPEPSIFEYDEQYPWAYGGPNHDNTTSFGDPLLFEFNASGSQRLILQPSYWVLGHLSRAARPGATVVGSGGAGVCTAPGDYEQIRAYATDREARAAAGLKLLAVAFRSAGLDEGLLSLYIPILICM